MLKVNVDEFFETFCSLESAYDTEYEGHTVHIRDEDRVNFLKEQAHIFIATLNSFIEEEEKVEEDRVEKRENRMKEEIVKCLDLFNLETMENFLRCNNIKFESEVIDWYTLGNERDLYELDIWVEDSFIQIFYDENWIMTHYEVEDD